MRPPTGRLTLPDKPSRLISNKTMKTIIILGALAVVVGFAALSSIFGSEVVVKNERVETVVETVVEDKLEVRIKAAQEAAHAEIEAEVETYRQQLLTEIADEVKMEYIKELESSITSPEY